MTTPNQSSTRFKQSHIRLLALFLGVAVAATAAAAERTPAASATQRAVEPLNVIVFWSASCGYCDQLFGQMETLRRNLAGTPVRFYAARIEVEAEVMPVAQRRTYGFEIAGNGSALASRYKVPAVPWVLITDCKDNIIASPSKDNEPEAVTGYVAMELGFRGYPTRQTKRLVANNSGTTCVLEPASS